MTSKDRAYLRSLASNIQPIFQVGKGSISDNLIKQVDDALEARELIKITVLETCPVDAKEVATKLAETTQSSVVQVMGRKITLYRKRKKDSKININVLLEEDNGPIPKVYEDENILVVNKPADLETKDVGPMLKESYDYIEPCHRIDRNTVGILLFAKNEEALNILLDKFKNNEIEKHYIACVYGTPKADEQTLNAYLFKDSKKSLVYISDEPKKAYVPIKTSYKVCKKDVKNKIAMLDVTLHTGKTHQIRTHLAHVGMPIIGDGKYGSYEVNKKFNQKTQMLCSFKIIFKFKTDAGILNYLNGMEVALKEVPFKL